MASPVASHTIQGQVYEYIQAHPGVVIEAAEVARALGLHPKVASAALARVVDRYPDLGLRRVHRGGYRSPKRAPAAPPAQQPQLVPVEPPNIGAVPEPLIQPNGNGHKSVGEIFLATGVDDHGFTLVEDEYHVRAVLVPEPAFHSLLAAAQDRARVEAVKMGLRDLFRLEA